MKALILNGEGEDEDLLPFQKAIEDLFRNKGIETESMMIRDLNLKYCIGCFHCWVGTPGECIHRDKGNEIDREVINSEYVVLLSTLTFGGYSPDLKIAVDRFLPLILPFFTTVDGETHHSMRYDRAPFLIGVGISDGHSKEEEKIFPSLLQRNGINFGCERTGHLMIDRISEPGYLTEEFGKLLDEKGVVG